MTERSDRIRLANAEERCEPSKPGPAKAICARALAALPQGAPMADHSRTVYGCTPTCLHFLHVSHTRRPPEPVQPRVHPPIGSES
jgi:hypothetical protein